MDGRVRVVRERELGQPVVGEVLLARTETLALVVRRVLRYSSGLAVDLCLFARDDDASGSLVDAALDRAGGCELAFPVDAGEEPHFRPLTAGHEDFSFQGGGGSGDRCDLEVWVEIPPVRIALACRWEERGLHASLDLRPALAAPYVPRTIWP